MNEITIDKKKYVIVFQKEYKALQKKAALKTKPTKNLSLEIGKRHAYKLIDRFIADQRVLAI